MTESFIFTEAKLRDLPLPKTNRVEYTDGKSGSSLKLRVSSSGNKTLFVMKWLPGKKRLSRITIGKWPGVTVHSARQRAAEIVGDVSKGIDPNEKKRTERAEAMTLDELRRYYEGRRKDKMKPSTILDYQKKIKNEFGEWKDLPINAITERMVLDKYDKSTSDNGFRVLRLLFNYAVKHELITTSPVSAKLEWRKPKRKTRIIKEGQLSGWYDAVTALKNRKANAYLLLLLYTGIREQEALKLLWEDVDLYKQIAIARNTKNHSDFIIHLPDILIPCLEALNPDSDTYVFQSKKAVKPMSCPDKPIASVIKKTGISFSSHDLRRTFATFAQDAGISTGLIQELLNHATSQNVTLGYIRTEPHTLRKSINQVAAYIASAWKY